MMEKLFKLKAHGTSVRQEVIAGLTTFLAMAYIIFVNPSMLEMAGMDSGAVFVATCLAAAIGCFIMGFVANYPIALAPGMGLNAFFTFVVVGQMGYAWQTALGAVFLSGICFLLLSLFKVREWIVNAIPMSLRLGIAAGIGLFLAFIGLQGAGIIVDNPATLVSLGDVTKFESIMAMFSFLLVITLVHFRNKAAVLISILVVSAVAVLTGKQEFTGVIAAPPSIAPTLMQMDLAGALDVGMISIVFAFLFVDLFDTSGTLIAVAQRGNLLDDRGRLPRLSKALFADSTATIAGAMLGTSTTTSYVESTAGVASGGRTGLTAVVVGVLFIACLLFSPLAGMVPAYATTGALLYVAILMMSGLVGVDWEDLTEAAPVVLTTLVMLLSYSISHGIAAGFISYAALKLMTGRVKQLNPAILVLALAFIVKYAVL
ncbi:NCS2 family permease [Ferrimonas sediminicola]|uniref:NCS2 family permease n=1 Tax=Ferrimonas sediminicola TaxID=2569538 RepID=A0A4U1BEQ8_9GAMM|nr:NCS2 family permease [Ferrimonas sediminicola]TKB49714.1 NCS2 family permease [Ferrimonas sediminicola]